MTDQLNPQKIKEGFWLIDNVVYVKAESAELKKETLLLKDVLILTFREQKGVGALFKGNFKVPLTKEAAP